MVRRWLNVLRPISMHVQTYFQAFLIKHCTRTTLPRLLELITILELLECTLSLAKLIRPRNISRRNCKYTSFVIFICYMVENNLLVTIWIDFQPTCFTQWSKHLCMINIWDNIQHDLKHKIQKWHNEFWNLC